MRRLIVLEVLLLLLGYSFSIASFNKTPYSTINQTAYCIFNGTEESEPSGFTELHYVTQSGAGAQDGESLETAWSLSDFNTAGNWDTDASDDGKIGPGDNVSFSGTITGQIIPQGSGLSGSYITFTGGTLNFDNDTVSSGDGMIQINGLDYLKFIDWTIDGDNATHPGSSVAFKAGIQLDPGSDYIIIDNCTITETLMGVQARDGVTYVTISDSLFSDIPGRGINSYSSVSTSDHREYWLIEGNTMVDIGLYLATDQYVVVPFINHDYSDHWVIRRNHAYCTASSGYGQVFIYSNESTYTLVEYNIPHDIWQAPRHRTVIDFKDDVIAATAGPTIVRFNHIYNIHADDDSWGSASGGITVGYNHHGFYAYGNYVHDCGAGINASISSEAAPSEANDGIDLEDIYIFANIIDEIQSTGTSLTGLVGASYDDIVNVHVFNNTYYRAGTYQVSGLGDGNWDQAVGLGAAAIKFQLNTAQYETGPYIYNNLMIDTRPNKSDSEYRQMIERYDISSSEHGHNHFYDSREADDIVVRYWTDGGSASSVVYDAVARETGYNGYDGTSSDGNPYLYDPANGHFNLTGSSGLVDPGEGTDLGSGYIAQISIYGETRNVPWAFALGDGTVFHATDPDQIVIEEINQDTVGWCIGAYAE